MKEISCSYIVLTDEEKEALTKVKMISENLKQCSSSCLSSLGSKLQSDLEFIEMFAVENGGINSTVVNDFNVISGPYSEDIIVDWGEENGGLH